MPEYPVGGRTCRGPVDAAYAETGAIDVPCPNCRVEAESFCVHPDGTFRKIPCSIRITNASRGRE